MFTFLLIVHAIIAASLVAVILMQRSEGGGLGMGQGPSGLMTARGAADFLTRATTILATLFVVMSIGLAALAAHRNAPAKIDTSLAKTAAPSTAGGTPPDGTQDVVNAAEATSKPDAAPVPGPGSATGNDAVPLAR